MSEKKKQGFAALSEGRRREIASLGGRAARDKGTAHRWNAEEAAAAGRKGGLKVGRDGKYMAELGRRGGRARGRGQQSQ